LDRPERPDRPRLPVVLTIAGHDPSSGAGITADLLVFAAHGLFGTSAITSLTVQSTLGVASVEPVSGAMIGRALAHLEDDLPAAGVKIGMLGSAQAVSQAAKYLHQKHKQSLSKQKILIVLDPILKSSSGADLLDSEGLEALRRELLPQVGWVTPNWQELAFLSGLAVSSLAEAGAAVKALGTRYPHLYVLVTGGDQDQPTDLLRLPDGTIHSFVGEHIATTSTHGTGCALSSALLSRLVLGAGPIEAVRAAKDYVTQALRLAPGLGHGHGPLNLLWPLTVR